MFGPDATKMPQQALDARRCACEVSGDLRWSQEFRRPQPHQPKQPQPTWSQGDLRGRLDATQ